MFKKWLFFVVCTQLIAGDLVEIMKSDCQTDLKQKPRLANFTWTRKQNCQIKVRHSLQSDFLVQLWPNVLTVIVRTQSSLAEIITDIIWRADPPISKKKKSPHGKLGSFCRTHSSFQSVGFICIHESGTKRHARSLNPSHIYGLGANLCKCLIVYVCLHWMDCYSPLTSGCEPNCPSGSFTPLCCKHSWADIYAELSLELLWPRTHHL